jgi:hypothetical protein
VYKANIEDTTLWVFDLLINVKKEKNYGNYTEKRVGHGVYDSCIIRSSIHAKKNDKTIRLYLLDVRLVVTS